MKIKPLVIILTLITGLIFTTGYGLAAPQRSEQVISNELVSSMSGLTVGQKISVLITLKDQVRRDKVSGKDREERRRNLLQELRNKSDLTQAGIRALLKTNLLHGKVSRFTALWINNAIAVTADSDVINQLAALPEVASITTDAVIQAPPSPQAGTVMGVPAANLSAINAPALWSLGYQGQGVVIASMDTGVDSTHPDLSAQWRGGSNSWYDPYGQHITPTDLNGHGTWTMGLMVGGGGGGTILGVAPQAQWIAVKIFNDNNVASISAIHLGFQWLLDPDNNPLTNDAPNVVNDSWDLGAPGCDLTFEPDLMTLVAANITPVFSAGNLGPNAPSDVSPANNPHAFSAGAVNNADLIASFSSRGPTLCGRSSSSTFPDVVAPGVAVTTTDLYGLYNTASGTSFSAPHLSGGIALLLSAFPELGVDQIHTALTYSTKDLGAIGPDAVFGNGRIDLLAAYNSILSGALPTSTPTLPPTNTPTALSTATATQVPTATATSTSLPSATSTSLPTATSTSLPTATSTSLPTATSTSLPTATSTVYPTSTRTPLPSATNTPLPSATPTQADVIFADGFESGSLSAWSSSATAGGRLSASAAAALSGSWGMQAQISNTTAMYVTDASPAAEASYHARFYFSPNGVILPSGSTHDILAGRSANGTVLFHVQVRRSSGVYQLRALVRFASGKDQASNWFTITNASHAIEIGWKAATTTRGTDGSLAFYLDGTLAATLSGVANGGLRLEETRLGPSGGLITGISGVEYYDAFISTRSSTIGP